MGVKKNKGRHHSPLVTPTKYIFYYVLHPINKYTKIKSKNKVLNYFNLSLSC